jgi:hypothetical protein
VLALALLGCGGSSQTAPARVPPPAAVKAEPVVETADMTPVARPPNVFVTGRIKRPTALADTVAHWAGLPLGLRDVLPFAAKDLDSVLLWDAPLELCVALAPGGSRSVVEGGFSLGLTGTEQALRAARAQGYEVKRLAPETYEVGGTRHLSCAIAPALGSAPARLVCAHRSSELDDVLPYMTRGLPNEPLGQKDLELKLMVEPLRQSFATQLGSARLFAGFLVRQLQLDAPRFDTALSDAAYTVADELVALVRDADSVRVEASVDDQKRQVDLELALTLADKKSWIAGVMAERSERVGPAPEQFFALPADAALASYETTRDPRLLEKLGTGLAELTDSYLEQQKIAKATRERVGRLLGLYFGWDGAMVSASGQGALLPSQKGAKSAAPGEWLVMRVEHAPAALRGALADLAGVLSDRDLRALVARTVGAEEKELPTVKLVPLRAKGVPAGTQALIIKSPGELGQLIGRPFGLRGKHEESPGFERALTIVPSGSGAVIVLTESSGELGARVAQALGPKGSTLATRPELDPLRTYRANWGGFTTLLSLLGSVGGGITNPAEVASGLPNHGRAPIFFQGVAEGTGQTASFRTTVPSGVFEDLPGLLPVLAASLAEHSSAQR